MDFYLKRPPFTPVSGLFGAKWVRFAAKWVRFAAEWDAFWCKMECVLVLNARCFGAKRKAKYC